MKLPAFQFYPADWKKDSGVQALSRHDRSVWFDMLCIMHESSERGVLLLGGKPMPDEALATLLGLDEILLKQILSKLEAYGVASRRQKDGAMFNRRMVKDENLIQIRRNAGKKGGNPVLLKQNPTTPDKQNPTPSSSSSSSDKKKPSKSRGTIEEFREHAKSIGLQQSDGEAMFHGLEANGWKRGNSPIKSWKAHMSSWKTQGYHPSQKNGARITQPVRTRL